VPHLALAKAISRD